MWLLSLIVLTNPAQFIIEPFGKFQWNPIQVSFCPVSRAILISLITIRVPILPMKGVFPLFLPLFTKKMANMSHFYAKFDVSSGRKRLSGASIHQYEDKKGKTLCLLLNLDSPVKLSHFYAIFDVSAGIHFFHYSLPLSEISNSPGNPFKGTNTN